MTENHVEITEDEFTALVKATMEAPGRSVPATFGSRVYLQVRGSEDMWALDLLAKMRGIEIK